EVAYVKMYHKAKDAERLPEYMKINGMWLNIHGYWVAPMVLLGYTSNSTSTSHVIWSERLTHEDDTSIPEGKHDTYTETLIVGYDRKLKVHVVRNRFNEDGTRDEAHCWSEFVDM
uniref:hypothetical protein n=1 Tax=Anaerotignum sp. TaxID=2039241 RepID=UPI0027B93641